MTWTVADLEAENALAARRNMALALRELAAAIMPPLIPEQVAREVTERSAA
jgi:hypothetical protein